MILVAWVIGGHALLGYSAIGGWPYDEINEVTFHPGVETVLAAVIGPSGLFFMGVFYFMAGLLTPDSVRRKGPKRFALERSVRLGLPWAASALLVWPFFLWVAYRGAGRDVSFWWVLTHRDPLLDSGSLWFVLVLLIFSVGYAALTFRKTDGTTLLARRHVVRVTVLVALTTFAVRLVFPARSGQIGDLHLWWWPQCLGMFALGIAGGRRLAERIPDDVYRLCRTIVVFVILLLPVAAAALGVLDLADDAGPFLGGFRWQAMLLAVIEGVLVVAGSLWMVGFAQRRLRKPVPAAVNRGAFVAFVVQGPILLLIATAVRPLAAPAEVKAPLVGALAIVLSFGIGWLVTRRRARA
ncbi:acyltransferase [Lentzea tibetensis]|uniref:Acyltransferase n=1 Tax=Lentzea tibetensis TaxID=2591470 RepID=A0A563EJ67_9PSEU|nr:acyltransferase [Lentzea tibetensis]